MATNEAALLRREKAEARQLSRLRKEKAKKKPYFYLWYMLLILALIYIVDEIATNLPNSLETELNINLIVWPWAQGAGFTVPQIIDVAYYNAETPVEIVKQIASGLFKIGLVKLLANAMLIASMFYRPLADKYGRKLFLFVNTIGMAAALFIIFTASNFWVFAIGFFVLRFFVTPDQQVVYIFEIAPEKWRGTAASMTKGVAELGLVVIALLRRTFLKESDVTSYRTIFLVIAIAAAVVAILALAFSRESDVFLDERIAYLEKTPEQREAEKKEISKAQGGFITAIRYAMKNKQLRWIMIATAVVEIAYSCCNNYSNVLNNGFLGIGALTQLEATDAMFYFPFTCAFITMIYGFLADKLGRKATSIILLAVATIAFVLEFAALYYSWGSVAVGLFLGLVLGADWANGDVYAMMAGESCPTNLRASIMSVWSLFFGVGMIASMGIAAVAPKFGLANLSLVYFLVAVPAWVIGLILLWWKVKETKGADLAKVGKDEE